MSINDPTHPLKHKSTEMIYRRHAIQWIALSTLLQREIIRMSRISIQIFLTPIISTVLYFLIFGEIVGRRIGNIQDVNYVQYIAPGLIMLAVINNAYANVASSLFSARFQRNIEEFLVSPAYNITLLTGYIISGLFRGFIISVLIIFITSFFIDYKTQHLLLTLTLIILVSICFSLAGFTNAILARNFEDIALIPTFVLSPLTYLGGVFFSVNMLPSFWKTLALINPILYMVDAFRHVLIFEPNRQTYATLGMMSVLILTLTQLNLYLLKKGVGIRE